MITEFQSTDVREQRIEFLEETRDFYTKNPHLQARDFENNSCFYRYGEAKCAAGRYISDEDYNEELEGVSIIDDKVFTLLPEHIQKLGKDTLLKVQCFHDQTDFRDKESIEDQFQYRLENIKKLP